MNNIFRVKKRHTGGEAHGVFHSQLGTPAVLSISSFVRATSCVKEPNDLFDMNAKL